MLAAVIKAVISAALRDANVTDPDLPGQHLTAPRALRILQRIRRVTLAAGPKTITLTTRTTPEQRQILAAIGVDTTTWPTATLA